SRFSILPCSSLNVSVTAHGPTADDGVGARNISPATRMFDTFRRTNWLAGVNPTSPKLGRSGCTAGCACNAPIISRTPVHFPILSPLIRQRRATQGVVGIRQTVPQSHDLEIIHGVDRAECLVENAAARVVPIVGQIVAIAI